MPRIIVRLILSLALILVSSSLYAELLIGTKVPNFQGQDFKGEPIQLYDFLGKIVVLEWSSPECLYSRRYYQNGSLNSLYDFAAKHDIIWINVVPRLQTMTPEEAKKQLNMEKKLAILDSNLDISTAFGAATTPQIFIIDKKGILAYTGAIDSSTMLKKTSHKVIPYTRNALEDMLAGREVQKKITRTLGCYVGEKRQVDKGIIGSGSR